MSETLLLPEPYKDVIRNLETINEYYFVEK